MSRPSAAVKHSAPTQFPFDLIPLAIQHDCNGIGCRPEFSRGMPFLKCDGSVSSVGVSGLPSMGLQYATVRDSVSFRGCSIHRRHNLGPGVS